MDEDEFGTLKFLSPPQTLREVANETIGSPPQSPNMNTLFQSPEPGTAPPIQDPSPNLIPVEEPDHPEDPGPAEDPDRQPVKN
jgi:hypothetical protein